jgi:preprotein translocase subunit SecF
MLPIIFALSLFFWALIVGASIVSSAKAHSTTSAQFTPSATAQLASKQTPMSLDSLKEKYLDQIRYQNSVSMANFGTTDQEIEIEIQPESNFDSAKAKNAALTVAKGWHNESHQ